MLKNSSCLFLTRRCHTCVAEIETVCLEGKFQCIVQMKAEGADPRVPPAADRGATLCEVGGTGPTATIGVNN